MRSGAKPSSPVPNKLWRNARGANPRTARFWRNINRSRHHLRSWTILLAPLRPHRDGPRRGMVNRGHTGASRNLNWATSAKMTLRPMKPYAVFPGPRAKRKRTSSRSRMTRRMTAPMRKAWIIPPALPWRRTVGCLADRSTCGAHHGVAFETG
jgi:hypothetical protein